MHPVVSTPPLTKNTGVIRPLQAGDRESIRHLLFETEVFTAEEIAIALELIDSAVTLPEQKDYAIFTHQTGNLIDGYYCIGPTPGTAGTYDLYWIAVAPLSQGQGIGFRMNSHAEEYVRSRGGRLVIAETSSGEKYRATRKFYHKRGYIEVARIRDYYRVGDDLVVYARYLTNTNEGG